MKVVINKCFGGYGLSKEAYEMMGIEWDGYGFEFDDDRSNKKLIDVVEKLGSKANGLYSELEVVEIPDGTDFTIKEYDGLEHVAEAHMTWG